MHLEAQFAGKVALVVGGYGAIGQSVSRTLAELGSHVVIAGRQAARAEALAHDISASERLASSVELDADDVPSLRHAVDKTWRRTGGIDFLINCIGHQREQPLTEVTEEGFDAVLRTNLKAAMFLGQAVARHQIDRARGGKHIHLLSLRATLGYRSRGYSAFTSSKGGLAALIRQHGAELAPAQITVNGVAPGIVSTAKNAALRSDPEALRRMIEPVPLGRLAEPADVGRVIALLCSSAFDFMTGQVLYLDGGMTSCR
jgi:NAD(P)-dependent dehydrogenase (short-subunit alcohol dehydrogenase family)